MTSEFFGVWLEHLQSRRDEQGEQPSYMITIHKVPQGGAPRSIRRAWKGLSMPAVEFTPSMGDLADPIRGKEAHSGFGFMVSREDGIGALVTSGKNKAAEYFNEKWPIGMAFLFSANEVDFKKL
jgi:hypothetical protein